MAEKAEPGVAHATLTRQTITRREALKVLSLFMVVGASGALTYRQQPWQNWLADYHTATGQQQSITLDQRIEKFYDTVCFDEIQDFAANDFNLICSLSKANVDIRLVGDFYQHTFDTSRDGNTQKSLHECFDRYCTKLNKAGFEVDLTSLSNSYRCSPSVCEFVSKNIGIDILSHRKDEVVVAHVKNIAEIDSIFNNDSVVKLFYQKSDSYAGNTANWGNTKGLDHFQDVCVVLNPTTLKAFDSSTLNNLNPTTKNKLYVACIRAKESLYFVSEISLKKYKAL